MKKLFVVLAALTLLTGAALPVLPALATYANPEAAAILEPDLRAAMDAAPGDPIQAIVTYFQAPDPAELASLGLSDYHVLNQLPMALVVGTAPQLQQLSAQPGVRSLYLNRPIQFELAQSVPATWADRVYRDPAMRFTGRGVGVAVVDSGIDATHPDLELGQRVVQNVKIVTGDGLAETTPGTVPKTYLENVPDSDTTVGHGTHVAGIIGGTGEASGGRFAGVAPGADLIGLSTDVGPSLFFILEAYDYILSNQTRYRIRVINNSWGSGPGPYDPEYPINLATRELTERGLVVVFSAGNDGPAPDTLGREKKAPWVIAVAAGTKDGKLAAFSSRGRTDNSETPTITAPGASIVSARAKTGSYINALSPLSGDLGLAPGDLAYYTTASGTSMAAPHVAGVVALMLEANPRLSPAQVKDILVRTATPMRGYQPFEVGAGYVNAYAAVYYAQYYAALGAAWAPEPGTPYWRDALGRDVGDPTASYGLLASVVNDKPYKLAGVVGVASAHFQRGEEGFFVVDVWDSESETPTGAARVTATFYAPDGSTAFETTATPGSTVGKYQVDFSTGGRFNQPGRYVVVFDAEQDRPDGRLARGTALSQFWVNSLDVTLTTGFWGVPASEFYAGIPFEVTGNVGQYQGYADATRVSVSAPLVLTVRDSAGRQVYRAAGSSDPTGDYYFSFSIDQPGAYEVRVEATYGDVSGDWQGSATRPITVSPAQ